jgi:hypothetical protein
MEIRPFRANDGMLIKRVRLRSLADAPYAFGLRSFEEEAKLPDSHWHELAAQVGEFDIDPPQRVAQHQHRHRCARDAQLRTRTPADGRFIRTIGASAAGASRVARR